MIGTHEFYYFYSSYLLILTSEFLKSIVIIEIVSLFLE